jgi:hypothetical protein
MKKNEIHPFANETECLQFGGMTVENRVDRVSIYGSLDLTLDKAGLEKARQLKAIMDLTLAELERIDLPDKIFVVEPETVENPFA